MAAGRRGNPRRRRHDGSQPRLRFAWFADFSKKLGMGRTTYGPGTRPRPPRSAVRRVTPRPVFVLGPRAHPDKDAGASGPSSPSPGQPTRHRLNYSLLSLTWQASRSRFFGRSGQPRGLIIPIEGLREHDGIRDRRSVEAGGRPGFDRLVHAADSFGGRTAHEPNREQDGQAGEPGPLACGSTVHLCELRGQRLFGRVLGGGGPEAKPVSCTRQVDRARTRTTAIAEPGAPR